jgi:hypothetical protein
VFIERYEAFDDWLALVISKARYYVPKPKRAGE